MRLPLRRRRTRSIARTTRRSALPAQSARSTRTTSRRTSPGSATMLALATTRRGRSPTTARRTTSSFRATTTRLPTKRQSARSRPSMRPGPRLPVLAALLTSPSRRRSRCPRPLSARVAPVPSTVSSEVTSRTARATRSSSGRRVARRLALGSTSPGRHPSRSTRSSSSTAPTSTTRSRPATSPLRTARASPSASCPTTLARRSRSTLPRPLRLRACASPLPALAARLATPA